MDQLGPDFCGCRGGTKQALEMKYRFDFYTLFTLILIIGCQPTHREPAEDKIAYPDAAKSIKEIYMYTIDIAVKKLFEEKDDFPENHKHLLKAYINQVFSYGEFEKMTIGKSEVLKKGKRDSEYRKTNEYKTAFKIHTNIAVPLAFLETSNCIGIYIRKIIDTDELTKPLFEKSKDVSDDLIISWIVEEVDIEKRSDRILKDVKLEKGDVLYSYIYSDQHAKFMHILDRVGLVIFRDGKLLMNLETRKSH